MTSHRQTGLRGALLLCCTLALGACTAGVTVPQEYVSPGWRPAWMGYVAKRGGMYTEVIGNPFANRPKADLERAVVEAMRGAHFGPEMPFFTEPPDGFASPYRLIVLFDPAPNTSGYLLCKDPDQPQAARPGRLEALAAFCLLDERISEARGEVASPEGPEDPRFRALMSQLSVLLFPGTLTKPGGSGDSFRRAG